MSFRPERVQPEFNDLITSLSNSRNQIRDNPLYQTIFLLIKRLTVSKDLTQTQIKDLDETLDNVLAASFLTVDDESNLLVNSRRELAGPGIIFNDATPNIRIISSSGGGSTVIGGNTIPILISEEKEVIYPIEVLGNYPPVSASSVSPSGYWAPLTDGNVDETDLIFANGEAIMVFVPV